MVNVRELIEVLQTKDPTLEVHIPFYSDGIYYGDTQEAYQVLDIVDKRGWALPGGPTEHPGILICTGSEGL